MSTLLTYTPPARKVRRPFPPFEGRGYVSPDRYMADRAARSFVDDFCRSENLDPARVAWIYVHRDRIEALIYREDAQGRLRVRRGRPAGNRRVFLRKVAGE